MTNDETSRGTVTARPDDRAVLRRTESVLRILDGRGTVVGEAARHRVDVAEVERWVRRARIGIARALRDDATSQTGELAALAPKRRHETGVFWASGKQEG